MDGEISLPATGRQRKDPQKDKEDPVRKLTFQGAIEHLDRPPDNSSPPAAAKKKEEVALPPKETLAAWAVRWAVNWAIAIAIVLLVVGLFKLSGGG